MGVEIVYVVYFVGLSSYAAFEPGTPLRNGDTAVHLASIAGS